MEDFSIRDYASRMRSADVVKCWPFDKTIDEETMKSLLPPISVKKFTWWFHELERLDSKSAPIDINSSKHKKRLNEKGKGKVPKKRSIVELFSVAPQVEKVISSSEEVDEEDHEEDYGFSKFQHGSCSHDQEINWGVKRKRNFKKKANKKEKEILLSGLKKANKLIKKPKKKTVNKENHSKLKQQWQDKAMQNPNSSHREESENYLYDRPSTHKLKPNLQHSDADNITMACCDFRSISENENPGLFGSGVLNNLAEEFSIEQPTQCFLQETVQESLKNKKKAKKHLNFLENDAILNPRKKPPLSVECFKLQKDSGLGTEDDNYAACIEEDSTVLKTNGIDFSRCPPVPFKDYLGTCNEFPLSDHQSNSKKQEMEAIQASPGSSSIPINNPHPFHGETFPYLAPDELLHNLLSLSRRSDSGNICGERIIGLPLNSKGELIALNSSSNAGVLNHTMKSRIDAIPCVRSSGDHSDFRNWDCRTLSKDQLNPFLVEHYAKENPPSYVIPSRPNISDLQSNRIDLNLGSLQIGDSSVDREKVEKSQSTMRLMGKEFLVGGRSFQEFEDERTGKDKQITEEVHFGSRSIGNVIIHCWNEQCLNKPRETLFPPDFTTNLRSESRFIGSHFDSRFNFMHQDGFAKRQFIGDGKSYPEILPSTITAVFDHRKSLFQDPVMCGYDKSQVSIIMHPSETAAYHMTRPYITSSAIHELRNMQNLHSAPKPAVRFPFMHPGLEGHVQSSLGNRFDASEREILISNSQPYWNLGTTHYPSVVTTESSMSLRPEGFCMYDIVSSASTLHRPIAPLSPTLTQRTLMPCYSGFLPISAVQERNGNQKKTRNRIISNIGIRGREHAKKPRRQPNIPLKPFKSPILGVQDGKCSNIENGSQIVARYDPVTPVAEAVSDVRFFEPQNLEKIYI